MALNRIWVYAEAADGKVSPLTLELLAKARSLGGTVEAVYAGGDADAVAGSLGAHGATKVHTTGDLGGSLPGVPVASAIAKAVADGNGPDLLMLGTTYDGRDIAARLSVAVDKPVITNNIDVEVDGDAVVVTEPVFGGTKLVKTKFTAAGPHIALFRPKSFVAEEAGGGAAEVASLEVTDAGHRQDHQPPRRGGHRPQARRGRRGRLRRPWARRGRQVRDDRDARQAAQGGARCLPCHRRRRLGALQLPGRPDRQGREAHRLHRGRHLGCHPAPRRHEGLEEHHRHQQGPRGADLLGGRPRHRRRRPQGPAQAHRGAPQAR